MILDFFKNLWTSVSPFLKIFVKTTISNMVAEIGDIALETVEIVEETKKGASGSEKFSEAYTILTSRLYNRGIKYTKNAVNIAIEMAVGVVKERVL